MNIFFSLNETVFQSLFGSVGVSLSSDQNCAPRFDVWTSRLIIMATGGFLLLCLAKLNKEHIQVRRDDWWD